MTHYDLAQSNRMSEKRLRNRLERADEYGYRRAIEKAISEAVAVEREACAAMCTAENEEGDWLYDTRAELAEAIRARGEKQTEEDAETEEVTK